MSNWLRQEDLEWACHLARETAAKLQEFCSPDVSREDYIESVNLQFKGPRDLLTQADLFVQQLLVDAISQQYPDHIVIAEEMRQEEKAMGAVIKGQPAWIIDPIDGTTNFAHKHPFYCISVGFWADGEAQLGVIVAPALNKIYYGLKGHGAFEDELARASVGPRRLQISGQSDLSHALLATGFSYDRRELDVGGLELLEEFLKKARGIRRGGSACLDFAHLAAGVFDGFWEYQLAPHDVAAGALLVQEAGGIVTNTMGGKDFLLGGGILAANLALHQELLMNCKHFYKSAAGENE